MARLFSIGRKIDRLNTADIVKVEVFITRGAATTLFGRLYVEVP